jgi:hypothetical protein
MLIAYCFSIIVCSFTSCNAPSRSRLMFMQMLDHMQAEPELEVQEEQVSQVFESPQATSCVVTIIDFEQGKPRCIPPIIFGFSFNHHLMRCLSVH